MSTLRRPGLAESLRSELILYGISVHAYFPGTILSPGLEEENKTKPKITLEIEGQDDGLTPAQCAKGLIKGTCLLFALIGVRLLEQALMLAVAN